MKEGKRQNLLGLIFNQSLSFKANVKNLYRKASQKLQVFSRKSFDMDTERLKQLTRALVLSPFSCCQLA